MISIITPLLNEAEYIESFLDHLKELRGSFEIMLVDGGSSDGTLKIIESSLEKFETDVKIISSTRGRAIQMNRGTEQSKGDILLFLHADCIVQKDSLERIEREIYSNKVVGGGFKQAFSTDDLFFKITSIFGNKRAKITNTFFGDYGIFVKRDIFEKVGGFDEIPFMEDIEFCKKIKKFGRTKQIDCYIFTSPRRYLVKGKLKITLAFIVAYFFNIFKIRHKFLFQYISDK